MMGMTRRWAREVMGKREKDSNNKGSVVRLFAGAIG